ncbi:uncharacterized protein LOC123668078 [Melitaea cinxia]|uniref:uncharacterized protein LOC123668078 n=1 Tax=Melitaea cinxia TaxID=113334 RepID=UPI001E274CB0|nr:uncharacterized protein LOC123668078 [Melitaea cinxia]
MEETFNKLKQDRRNSLDNLIQWMKDSKVIDGVKVTEDKARKLFEDVADAKNIEIGKFKEALTKLASEQQKNIEEFTNILAKEGPKFVSAMLEAASAAASTLKESLAKK